jgi:hypothetical protein
VFHSRWAPIETILLGLFGGLGATVIWDFIKTPIQTARLARGIAAEVKLMRSNIADRYESVTADLLVTPGRFTVPPTVFAANAGRVGELAVVEGLVLFYAQVVALRDAVDAWNDEVDLIGANRMVALPENVEIKRSLYCKLAEQALTSSGDVLPKLTRLTRPWFDLRRWKRVNVETLQEIKQAAATGRSRAP